MTNPARHLGPPADLPLLLTLDGDEYELPAVPTRALLDALVGQRPGCWMALVPGELAGDGPRDMVRRLYDPDDAFDLDDVEHLAEQVLGQVCGIALDPACRLAATVYGNWVLFDGWCASVGMRPLQEPIGRLLAAAYTWRRSLCVERSDLTRLDAEIWVSAPAVTASGAARDTRPPGWDDEHESVAFMAAMSTLGAARGQRR